MEILEYVVWIALGFGPTLGALEIAQRTGLKDAMVGGKASIKSRSPSSFTGKESEVEKGELLSVR